jgi:uncharacterized protein YgiM (DUF1202 family)
MRTFCLLFVAFCLFSFSASAEESVYIRPKRQSNVRADSTTGADILTVVSPDVILEANVVAYDWYKITLPPQTPAYVASQFINEKGECTVAKLNIRKEASTTGLIIGKLKAGDVVAVMERNGEWTRINAYPYAQGWISMQQVTKVDRAAYDGYLASLPAIRSIAPQAPVAAPAEPTPAPAISTITGSDAKSEKNVVASPTVSSEKPETKNTSSSDKAKNTAMPVKEEKKVQASLDKANRRARAEAEKAERLKKEEEAKKLREEERRKEQEAKVAARKQREQEKEEQRIKEKAADLPQKTDAVKETKKNAASPDAWDQEFKSLLDQHNALKKRISEVMDDENVPATNEAEKNEAVQQKAQPKIDPATYADAKIVGDLLKTRKRSIPANAMIKSDEGEQMLVCIPESEKISSLLNRKVAVWGNSVTKDGYTYLEVNRIKIIE